MTAPRQRWSKPKQWEDAEVHMSSRRRSVEPDGYYQHVHPIYFIIHAGNLDVAIEVGCQLLRCSLVAADWQEVLSASCEVRGGPAAAVRGVASPAGTSPSASR